MLPHVGILPGDVPARGSTVVRHGRAEDTCEPLDADSDHAARFRAARFLVRQRQPLVRVPRRPCANPPHPRPLSPQPTPPASPPPVAPILLIATDDLPCERLARRLARAGQTVHQAAEGTQGGEILRTTPITLVITTIIMPGHEGTATRSASLALIPPCPWSPCRAPLTVPVFTSASPPHPGPAASSPHRSPRRNSPPPSPIGYPRPPRPLRPADVFVQK